MEPLRGSFILRFHKIHRRLLASLIFDSDLAPLEQRQINSFQSSDRVNVQITNILPVTQFTRLLNLLLSRWLKLPLHLCGYIPLQAVDAGGDKEHFLMRKVTFRGDIPDDG